MWIVLALASAWAGEGAADSSAAPDEKVVRWSDVRVKVRPRVKATDYPEAANTLPREKLACTVRIFIDLKGMPTHTEPQVCDPALQESVSNIAMRYRFHPVKAPDGEPIRVAFDLRVNFAAPTGGPTDIVTESLVALAAVDAKEGFAPIDPATLAVRREAPSRLRFVPTGARAHAMKDRVCRLRVHLGASGVVKDTLTVRCAADLRDAAQALVEAWRFAPVEGGTDVSFDALVSYDGAAPVVIFVAAEPVSARDAR